MQGRSWDFSILFQLSDSDSSSCLTMGNEDEAKSSKSEKSSSPVMQVISGLLLQKSLTGLYEFQYFISLTGLLYH